MKILISWAGEPSHKIALVLRDYLPSIIPAVIPWVSSEDIPKGARWGMELARQLEDTSYGIIVCVPNNVDEPWLNYEAGALSKSIDLSRVWTLLFRLTPSQLSEPLAQFQATTFEKEDVCKLMRSINEAVGPEAISFERLIKNYEIAWPSLSKAMLPILPDILRAPVEGSGKAPGAATLSEEHLGILKVMAHAEWLELPADAFAKMLGIPIVKAEHYLDVLHDLGYIGSDRDRYAVTGISGIGAGHTAHYYLSKKGRAFVVEENLM